MPGYALTTSANNYQRKTISRKGAKPQSIAKKNLGVERPRDLFFAAFLCAFARNLQ
jgi:hypothetical protein